jgi:hypothetical protein
LLLLAIMVHGGQCACMVAGAAYPSASPPSDVYHVSPSSPPPPSCSSQVAQRLATDPWQPGAVVGIAPVSLRQMRLRGRWVWVAVLGQPSVEGACFLLPGVALVRRG